MKLKERCLVSVVLAIRSKLGTALLTSALFKYGSGLDFFYQRIRPDQTTTSVAAGHDGSRNNSRRTWAVSL